MEAKLGIIEKTLIEKHGITPEQIEQAHKLNSTNHAGFLSNLIKMGAINEKVAVETEASVFNAKIVRLKNYPVQPDLFELIPEELLKENVFLPLQKQGNLFTVATSSFLKSQAQISNIQKHSKCLVTFVLAFPSEISERLNRLSNRNANFDQMLETKAKELNVSNVESEPTSDLDPNGPVAQVLSHLLNQALGNGASDIHFEPMETSLRIRFREDGVLKQVKVFDKVFSAPFSAAVKVMASMDIAETRLPQDGSISQTFSGRRIDFRVATYPTEYGEKIVLRILDSQKDWISVEALNLPEKVKSKMVQMIEAPQGLILCAGPTGSGKTSTLYAMLKHLNNPDTNILTTEDPIEYRMTGITQAQVNGKKGLTFATALRAMLRLDPNVILVGEMRDAETAEIGCQAALTGHLVLSTVHANSSTQTVTRLIDMGIENFIVASSLQGVISQRLIRKLCVKCRMEYSPTAEEAELLSVESLPKTLFKAKGCHVCRNEGYKGRLPVLEVLSISNPMRALISQRFNSHELFEMAVQEGLWTIHEDALEKAKAGLTSIEEILRVLGPAVSVKPSVKTIKLTA